MDKKRSSLILFQEKHVRRHRDEEKEMWYFSIIDIIELLTENHRSRKYWNDLKKKLLSEGSQLSEKIGQLKILSMDRHVKFTMTEPLNNSYFPLHSHYNS